MLRTGSSEVAHSRVKCAHFFSVPSGDRSANHPTSGVLGRSGLQQASCPVFARVCCETGVISPSGEGIGKVFSVVLYRFQGTRHITRGQSREANTLSRLSGSMETSAKCLIGLCKL